MPQTVLIILDCVVMLLARTGALNQITIKYIHIISYFIVGQFIRLWKFGEELPKFEYAWWKTQYARHI